MRALSFIPVLLCTSLLFAQQETVITGKLVGYDKKPMAMAHVHLIKAPNPKPIDEVQADGKGSFRLATKETGLFVLVCTGVNHSMFNLPLIVEKPTKIDLTVSLSTYQYVDDMKDVKIMSDATELAADKPQPMEKQSDGTYAVELESSKAKLAYQILGAEKNGRTINGTQSDAYEYDGDGDYRSIVTPKDGKVRVVFDPNKTIRSSVDAEVKFTDPSTRIAKIAGIQLEMIKRSDTWSTAIRAFVAAGNDYKTYTYDWSTDQASIIARLKTEKDQLVRQALLLDYVDTKAKNATKADPKIGARVFKEIPPDSKLWMMPTLSLLKVAADLSGDDSTYEHYLSQFLEKNPDASLKMGLIFNQLMLAKSQNDEKQLKLYYDLTVKFFGDTPFGKMVMERFSPTIAIAIGKTVPAFKAKVLEDTLQFYTNETFKGKVYLMDFWATWCGPCLGEMESLHNAYEKFKSKNFEILSISLDRVPADVATFRADTWKMPWLHAFATYDTTFTNAFEVVTIPRPLLVDQTGKILAMDLELRGAQLEKTLAKFLREPK